MPTAEQLHKELQAIAHEEEQLKERKKRLLEGQKQEILSLLKDYCEALQQKETDVLLAWFPTLSRREQILQTARAESKTAKQDAGSRIAAYRVPGKDIFFFGSGGIDKMPKEFSKALREADGQSLEAFLNAQNKSYKSKAWFDSKLARLREWHQELNKP